MAKIAQIYIDGEVLPENYIWDDEVATSLYRVRKQVEAAGTVDRLRLNIYSPGGYCFEGWAIVDYLRNLNLPIDTFAYGQCASFGTIFHTMGEVREVSPNCEYMVHRPWGGTFGNDIEIDLYNASLKLETKKGFEHYSAATGMTVDELAALIQKDDLYLTPQETVDKRFSTTIFQPAVAGLRAGLGNLPRRKAVYLMDLKDRKVNPNAPKDFKPIDYQTQMAEKKKSLIDAAKSFLAMLNGEEPKALTVTLKDGSTIETNSTGDTPVVGDTATINGAAAPDGSYEMEDGTVLTVKDGVITAVADAAADSGEGATAVEVAALRQENTDLKTRMTQMETRMKAVLGQIVSEEVPTQANRIPVKTKDKPTAEQIDRETMLANHLAQFGLKPKAQA